MFRIRDSSVASAGGVYNIYYLQRDIRVVLVDRVILRIRLHDAVYYSRLHFIVYSAKTISRACRL